MNAETRGYLYQLGIEPPLNDAQLARDLSDLWVRLALGVSHHDFQAMDESQKFLLDIAVEERKQEIRAMHRKRKRKMRKLHRAAKKKDMDFNQYLKWLVNMRRLNGQLG